MKDIVDYSSDLIIMDAQTSKAKNILQTQIGDLEYAPDFGIDLKFFLSEGFQFQNESFKAYLVQRLSEQNVTVASVEDVLTRFTRQFNFSVGDLEPTTGSLIR